MNPRYIYMLAMLIFGISSMAKTSQSMADSLRALQVQNAHLQQKVAVLEKEIVRLNDQIEKNVTQAKKESYFEHLEIETLLNDSIAILNAQLAVSRTEVALLSEQLRDAEARASMAQSKSTQKTVPDTKQEPAPVTTKPESEQQNLPDPDSDKEYGAKLNALTSCYSEVVNSKTFKYTKWADIKAVVADYEQYVTQAGLTVPADVQGKLDHINKVTPFGDYYTMVVTYFDGKYDADVNNSLLKEYSKLKHHTSCLNEGQHAVFAQLYRTLCDYPDAINNFKNAVIKYISEDRQVTPSNKDDLIESTRLSVKLFADSKNLSDKSRYNPYYTNLNKALDALLKGIPNANNKGQSALSQLIADVTDMI